MQQLVQRIYTFVFNFNFDTTPLWYLYMLIGLYLLMPVLNAWLVQASQRELKVVLGLWVVSLFLPYLKMLAPVLGYQGNYGNMELLGMCRNRLMNNLLRLLQLRFHQIIVKQV